MNLKIIDSDLNHNVFLKTKEPPKWTFNQWKVWLVGRQIDLQRQILVLREYKETLPKWERGLVSASIASMTDKLYFLESIQRRVSENDTIEIIERDMKKKALRDIDKWENGMETD